MQLKKEFLKKPVYSLNHDLAQCEYSAIIPINQSINQSVNQSINHQLLNQSCQKKIIKIIYDYTIYKFTNFK